MNKIGDILKNIGDFASFSLLGHKPDNAFWNAGKPYDPQNSWIKDLAMAISPKQKTKLNDVLGATTTPTPSPSPTPTSIPTPTPYPRITADQVRAGLRRFNNGQDTPISDSAEAIANVGNALPGNINPFFPAAVAGKESTMGKNIKEGSNNPLGIMTWDEEGNRELATYPDFNVAFEGGGPRSQRGFKGTVMGGLYDKFLKSGDYGDFFNSYTPPGGENPNLDEQVATLNAILNSFQFK